MLVDVDINESIAVWRCSMLYAERHQPIREPPAALEPQQRHPVQEQEDLPDQPESSLQPYTSLPDISSREVAVASKRMKPRLTAKASLSHVAQDPI